MAGLFTSPAQQRAAEAKARAQHATQFMGQDTPIAGQLFNFGDAVGKSIASGLFGIETRSPAEMKAAEIQSTMQGINWESYDSVTEAAKKFSSVYPQGALQLLQHANDLPTTTTTETKWGSMNGADGKPISGVRVPWTEEVVRQGGDRVVSRKKIAGSPFKELSFLVDQAKQSTPGKEPKRVGNLRVGEDVYQVFDDRNGKMYALNNGKRDYKLFNENKENVYNATAEEIRESSLITKAEHAQAVSMLDEMTKVENLEIFGLGVPLSGAIIEAFTGLSGEEKQIMALDAILESKDRWPRLDPEVQRAFGGVKKNFTQSLLLEALKEKGKAAPQETQKQPEPTSDAPAVGATATNPNTGEQVRWDGNGWVAVQ